MGEGGINLFFKNLHNGYDYHREEWRKFYPNNLANE